LGLTLVEYVDDANKYGPTSQTAVRNTAFGVATSLLGVGIFCAEGKFSGRGAWNAIRASPKTLSVRGVVAPATIGEWGRHVTGTQAVRWSVTAAKMGKNAIFSELEYTTWMNPIGVGQ
jgi:hypothetical protein